MNTSQILETLKKTEETIRDLNTQLGKAQQQRNLLTIAKRNSLMKHFSNYIELNTQFEFKEHVSFSGAKIGLKKGELNSSPHFAPGDIIIWTKKNPKSIVVKCIKKFEHKWERGGMKVTETTPDSFFRIELESLYSWMVEAKSDTKKGFMAYVMRTESLEELGI